MAGFKENSDLIFLEKNVDLPQCKIPAGLKKLTIFTLLFVFVYTLVGFYPVFLLRQHLVKNEIKQRIKQAVPENELSYIAINAENTGKIIWKNDHEFTYKGNMYDVVRVEKSSAGETVYCCINDIQEKRLFANLKTQIQNNFEGNNRNDKKTNPLTHLIKDYLPYTSFHIACFSIAHVEFGRMDFRAENQFLDISVPPPKTV